MSGWIEWFHDKIGARRSFQESFVRLLVFADHRHLVQEEHKKF
jgi:hypothetical protein